MINLNNNQGRSSNSSMRAESLHNLTKNKLSLEANIHNKTYQQIILKIKDLDEQNKSLISISNSIMTTSFYKNQKMSFPTILSEMQIDMKNAFNQLIASIQQYYADIDTKIKDICVNLTTYQFQRQSSSLSHSTQNHHGNYQQHDKLTILTKKMQSLEQNLKRTQSNQKNLISVIDKLLQKYQPTEQVTLIREDPILNMKVKNMNTKQNNERKNVQKKSNLSLNKNNLYSKQTSTANRYNFEKGKDRGVQKSIHQQLRSIQSSKSFNNNSHLVSDRTQTFSDYDVGQDKCFIKKIYCKLPYASTEKVSLKLNNHFNKQNYQFKPREQYIQESNKTHRQDYLMRNLKR